jgi:hypothetical protein
MDPYIDQSTRYDVDGPTIVLSWGETQPNFTSQFGATPCETAGKVGLNPLPICRD